jgi:hypothetical protein
MRGDSLRDLYAKMLALVGLGVLAGTGALVDYWPSGVTLPMVDAGLTQAELARSLPVPDRQPNFVAAAPARARSARPAVTVVQTAAVEAPTPRIPALALAPSDDVLLDVSLAQPPAAVPVQTFAFSMDYSLGEEVPLTEPDPWPIATLAMSAPPVSLSDDDEHGGLLTGMVKRTGSSIVRGGRKTGASIMEAFRVVSGAVRRALPN